MAEVTGDRLDELVDIDPLQLRDVAISLLAERNQLRTLLRDMVDPDPCYFDHHGGCQAHGYLSLQPGEKCPHAEAKELLGEAPS